MIVSSLLSYGFFAFSSIAYSQDSATASLTEKFQTIIKESMGKQAPPLYFQDIKDSSTHQLIEYSGKVLLLNFWSPSCKPCIEEMPDISYLQEEYEKAGLVVIYLDGDFETQNRFFKIHEISGLKATRSADFTEFPSIYNFGTPLLILIDRDGKVKDCWAGVIGYDAIEKRINKLIPIEEKSFKFRNPGLVLLSSITLVGLCMILITIIWNKKRIKAIQARINKIS